MRGLAWRALACLRRGRREPCLPFQVEPDETDLARTYQTVVQGIRDYFRNTGFERAVLGLSGGLDSTIVTTIVRKFTDTPLRTFSVVFDDPEFDERRYQQEVIDFLGAEHARVRCSYGDIARVFPSVVRHAERPILRTAPAPLFLLSNLVRDSGFKVVLTGEGADEILGGYLALRHMSPHELERASRTLLDNLLTHPHITDPA